MPARPPRPTPDDTSRLPVPAGERRPARRAGRMPTRALRAILTDLPSYLRLLAGLARDPRVSALDKGIVLATLGYLAFPGDLVPDWLPFLGQVDDLLLVALALDRLVTNAGPALLHEHWDGDPATLDRALAGLDRATAFIPAPIRRLIFRATGTSGRERGTGNREQYG